MGKSKKRITNTKPFRPRPQFTPARRLNMICKIITDTLDNYMDEEGVPNLVFLVVHGHAKKTRCSRLVTQPHFAPETVEEIMRESFEDYSNWGKGDHEHENAGLVDSAVKGLVKAIHTFVARDTTFGETVVVGAYPGGATMMGYILVHGVDADFMRRMVFDDLGMRFPGENPDAMQEEISSVVRIARGA